MKIINKIAVSLTALASASTIICGFSIASKSIVETSSIQFHTVLGVLTILLSFSTFALLALQQRNKA